MADAKYYWLHDIGNIDMVATLGPEGTSSEFAATYLSEDIIRKRLEIKLFQTFETGCDYSESNRNCVFLVANAYRDVNVFYMSKKVKLLGSFYYSPPPYYICC